MGNQHKNNVILSFYEGISMSFYNFTLTNLICCKSYRFCLEKSRSKDPFDRAYEIDGS